MRELQKYVDGDIIYIPSAPEKSCRWGEKNGTREKYRERNDEIRMRHRGGTCAAELAREYALSFESIRKILYAKD